VVEEAVDDGCGGHLVAEDHALGTGQATDVEVVELNSVTRVLGLDVTLGWRLWSLRQGRCGVLLLTLSFQVGCARHPPERVTAGARSDIFGVSKPAYGTHRRISLPMIWHQSRMSQN